MEPKVFTSEEVREMSEKAYNRIAALEAVLREIRKRVHGYGDASLNEHFKDRWRQIERIATVVLDNQR